MAKTILIIGGIIEIVFRGLPAFFGSPAVADIFGLEYLPGFIPYVHAFGAVMITFGIMMIMASKAPEKHLLIMNIAILRFGLGIAAQFITFMMQGGHLHIFWWIHMTVDALLVIFLLFGRTQIVGHAEA